MTNGVITLILSRREYLLLLLLIGIGVFNTVDYYFTDLLVVQQGHQELNPLMRPIVYSTFFFVYKMVLIPAALWLLWRLRHVVLGWLFRLVWFTFFAYLSLMVYIKVVFYS